MIKRMIWMGFGAILGASSWAYANKRVRGVVDRYAPAEVRDRLAGRARGVGGTVKSALVEGRDAMAAKERELRGS
ncbi:MAG: hypothetical protein GY708_23445 [Actinomycetia bacterium]|nr:hypothetical protein [Actinomycetes bacterium]